MRLDVYLTSELGVESRAKAANLIKLGKVAVDGKIAEKASLETEGKKVEIRSDMEFASMGGYKLEKAACDFALRFDGLTVADIGASNGGFTHCALSLGAERVYAVDVGECALPDYLKNDGRVCVRDRLNARDITIGDIGEEVDRAVIDVSFISLKLILPAVGGIVKRGGDIIALIKPQFEVGKKYLSKKGIVLDKRVRESAAADIIAFARTLGLIDKGLTTAPVREGKNIEYLVRLIKA